MLSTIKTLRYYARKLTTLANGLIPSKECCVCGAKFHHFDPYRHNRGKLSAFVTELDFMTGDIDNFSCPFCQASDRERHLFLFFEKLGLWKEFAGASVLHFAPEAGLRKKIESFGPHQYIKADLFSENPDISRIDVMDIPFPDEHFDFILCCHVLEHVPDENKALAELRRVLKPGGHGVLQTPFSRLLAHTFQDSNINTDMLRWRYYGQEDHVRMFGQDLFDKIRRAGFVLDIKRHGDFFNEEDARRLGICSDEDLILVSAPT